MSPPALLLLPICSSSVVAGGAVEWTSSVLQIGPQPLPQLGEVDVVHAALAGQLERVRGAGAHGRARAHHADAGQRGGVAVDAATGGEEVVHVRGGHGTQRYVVHVVGVE